MFDLLSSDSALWFSVPALLGTGVFLLRMALMLVGGDADVDADVDVDLGDVDIEHGDSLDSDHAFTVLSIQGVAAFLMGFGWAGVGGLLGAGWSVPASAGVGVVGGVAMTWILGLLLKAMSELQSSGTVSIESTVGVTGDVYVAVPAHNSGRGQVRVVVGERMRIYNAVTEGEALPSQSRVRVLAVNDDNTLTIASA